VKVFGLVWLVGLAPALLGTQPATPTLAYAVHVDPADTTGFTVTLHVGHAPDAFQLAMAAHPEYDDRSWRDVRDLTAESPAGQARISEVEGPLWTVTGSGGDVTIRYRMALPAQTSRQRAAYRPFVSPTGALVGGIHSFMYLVGATRLPARVTVEVPEGWRIATGLGATGNPRVFSAPSARVLMDSPILVGNLREWDFAVNHVPHRVFYWPAPDAAPFDSGRFVSGIRAIVQQTIALFGSAPYRDYTFLLQDDAYGSLEHADSVTIGVPSADLAQNPSEYFEEIAHEFFHAWNMMRLRPREWGDVSYRSPPKAAELWWSEGATMYYADLLCRRAGLPTGDSTRVAHLARLIGEYDSTSGNRLLSPERVSRAAYGPQGTQLGDNTASTHLQGELITAALDLLIRDATHDRRSIDDVMRAIVTDHSGPGGFSTDDVEHEAERACGCSLADFFARHVHGAEPLDMNRYLAFIGLSAQVTWSPAIKEDGSPQPDLRVAAWQQADESGLRLYVLDTQSVWEQAGLHTGDRLVAINGRPVSELATFRSFISSLAIGDTVRLTVDRPAGPFDATVVVAGYRRATATISERPDASAAERTRRAAWERGNPRQL
jgi:predicted metalloprotease with PDZ domain